MSSKHILAVLAFTALAGSVHAQPTDPGMARLLQEWAAIPEDQNMREVCLHDLTFSTAIRDLMAKQASVAEVAKWENDTISQEIRQYPQMAPIDIFVGDSIRMNELIINARLGAETYQYVRGGFPQFAYRSCLKGKSLK